MVKYERETWRLSWDLWEEFVCILWRTIVKYADRRVGGREDEEVVCMMWRSAPREVDRREGEGERICARLWRHAWRRWEWRGRMPVSEDEHRVKVECEGPPVPPTVHVTRSSTTTTWDARDSSPCWSLRPSSAHCCSLDRLRPLGTAVQLLVLFASSGLQADDSSNLVEG